MGKTILIYYDDTLYHEYMRKFFEEERNLETDRQFREERLLKEWDKEIKSIEENEDKAYYEKYLLAENEALEEKRLFMGKYYSECEEFFSGTQMKSNLNLE